MNERERAEKLANDLDQFLTGKGPFTEQTAPEDQPLLHLSKQLVSRNPFAPNPSTLSKLRRRLERSASSRRNARMKPFSLPRALSPVLQSLLVVGLLAGLFSLILFLIPTLLEKPVHPSTGAALPSATAPAPIPSATAAPTQQPTPIAFPVQIQTVNNVQLELRDFSLIGDSVQVTICFPEKDNRGWRLENVSLIAGVSSTSQTFFPANAVDESGRDQRCQTLLAPKPDPVVKDLPWIIGIGHLVAPRSQPIGCGPVEQQVSQEYPGLVIGCEMANESSAYTIKEVPASLTQAAARDILHHYLENEVLSGPWSFSVSPDNIAPVKSSTTPAYPVAVSSACITNSPLLSDPAFTQEFLAQSTPWGIAGGGKVQSGDFTFLLTLACDPTFDPLNQFSKASSRIGGLGVLWAWTYQGEPIANGVSTVSGVAPFEIGSNGGGGINRGDGSIGLEGIQFPAKIQPDFTQSDVTLRYLVRVTLPDGKIEGAALVFTLKRQAEGFLPTNVKVDQLTDAERQNVDFDPSSPLPFPTLEPKAQSAQPLENQALIALIDQWQSSFKSSPGWVHARLRMEMVDGNTMYGGLKTYRNDAWYQVDEQGMVITQIHVDETLEGQPLQQSYVKDGKAVNLTFGGAGMTLSPAPFDLMYSLHDAFQTGKKVERSQETVDGKPVTVLTIFVDGSAGYVRREFIDPTSGALLYSELYDQAVEPGQLGRYTGRITLEAGERVDAPPEEALKLLQIQPGSAEPLPPIGTPAPAGFDPSGSALSMRAVSVDNNRIWYGDIFAGDYLLGRVPFGSEPGSTCDRSPDGSKLAFSFQTSSPDGTVTDMSLRWLSLPDLKTIHQPAPELVKIGFLSWSPVEEQLAFFGCQANDTNCGLYLLDPATDTIRLLMPAVYSIWDPVWKTDGKQLAFVDHLKEGYGLYVVEIATGKVVYQGKFDADKWRVPSDSPLVEWGKSFPRSSAGNRCFRWQ